MMRLICILIINYFPFLLSVKQCLRFCSEVERLRVTFHLHCFCFFLLLKCLFKPKPNQTKLTFAETAICSVLHVWRPEGPDGGLSNHI